jgi:hypothetical protein
MHTLSNPALEQPRDNRRGECAVTKPIPIHLHLGDVLILQTTQSYTIYAVGRVSEEGQQDFSTTANVKRPTVSYESDYAAAVVRAKALVDSGGRIFMLNIDTTEWSEISG